MGNFAKTIVSATHSWYSNGGVLTTSPSTGFLGDVSGSRREIGLHLDSLAVPNAATIVCARILLSATTAVGTGNNFLAMCEDIDDASPHTIDADWSGASLTTGTSPVNVPWTASAIQRLDEIDCTVGLQAVVDRAGWVSGNAVNFLIHVNVATQTGGYATVPLSNYSNEAYKPTIVIGWTTGGGGGGGGLLNHPGMSGGMRG